MHVNFMSSVTTAIHFSIGNLVNYMPRGFHPFNCLDFSNMLGPKVYWTFKFVCDCFYIIKNLKNIMIDIYIIIIYLHFDSTSSLTIMSASVICHFLSFSSSFILFFCYISLLLSCP